MSDLVGIILVSILMGAFNFGFFILGYYLGTKKPIDENSVVVDENNKDAVEAFIKFINFKK